MAFSISHILHHEKDLFGKILTFFFTFIHCLQGIQGNDIIIFEIVRFYFYSKLTTNVDLLVQLENYLSASVINERKEKKTNFGSHHTTLKIKG